jgi:vacuolar-type H+-ATPase subunit I/STV1
MTTQHQLQKTCDAIDLREANRRTRDLSESLEACGDKIKRLDAKIESNAKVIAALREALAPFAVEGRRILSEPKGVLTSPRPFGRHQFIAAARADEQTAGESK